MRKDYGADADVDAEIVANSMFEVLADEKTINELAEENPSLLKKLLKHIKAFIADIKTIIAQLGNNWAEVKAFSKDLQALESIRWLMESALSQIDTTSQTEKNTATEDGEIKWSIKHPVYSKSDIEENMIKLAKMNSVFDVNADKLKKTGRQPSEIFEDFFKSLNNNIYSDEFGDIALGKSSVKSEIRHGRTAEKIASIEAIPSVIKRGKVIFFEKKNDSDVDRIVVAAPITIGNTPYYTGVMLQRDSKYQRLYLHNVVIEKETSINSQADLLTTGALENNEHLFITTILQKALVVKNNYMPKSEKDTSKYSYASSKAKNSNLTKYAEAVRLESEGHSSEEIRQQTGWFRGYDNKWRFEIDDSKMVFSSFGDIRLLENSDYQRLVELSDNYKNLDKKEKQELLSLERQFEDDIWNEDKLLVDYVSHPELFEAYPQLKTVNLTFVDMNYSEKGYYDNRTKTIALNRKDPSEWKNTILHELQHAIQHIEGLTSGASVEYWNEYLKNAGIQNPIPERVNRLYINTAGEIEANDVANRVNFDADRRKNTRPDIDREDVVFAEGNISYSTNETVFNSFGIKKYGDYIHVQKQVYNTLQSEGFFTDANKNSRTVKNNASGMFVEINKSGINETFNADNYARHSKALKTAKLASIRFLPEIIENGILLDDDVANNHNKNSSIKYAYLESIISLNGNDVAVKVAIRKSAEKNKFWVHSVDIKNNTESKEASEIDVSDPTLTTFGVKESISQDIDDVKPEYSLQSTDEAGKAREKLIRQNKNLRVANMILKQELVQTNGNMLSYEDSLSLAREIKRAFQSSYDSDTLAEEIYNAFRWYDRTDNSYEQICGVVL